MDERTKRFKLTTEQVKDIRDALESIAISEELLAGLLDKLSDKQAKKRRQTWESAAEMLGADRNLLTVGDYGINARLNYLTSEIVLDGSEEALEKHLPHIPFHD